MFSAGAVYALLLTCSASAAGPTPQPVDFAREVFPIFQRACFECHGPKKHEADLRLDLRDSALRTRKAVIVPGRSRDSELIRRISLPKGHEDLMPHRGEPLSAAEVSLIIRWIDEGARWPDGVKPARHWAYVAPKRSTLPSVTRRTWPRNAIDYFVLARLEREGLSPSPDADRAVLLRRVYLDLTGLPPSPEAVRAFVDDTSADAYEKRVKQLLASPQFGERWARPWLDLAHYADSHGFQRDDLRESWAYRDWVIRALNADMPFDQFTRDQLAGDLLPDATQDQKIATGFGRCAPTNVEAGSEPEETRVNQVLDRVNTVGAAWLGTTLECCQCHDHKYDPFTSKDYYQLFAFFNSTAKEADRTNPKVPGSIKFNGPFMTLMNPELQAEEQARRSRIAALDQQITTRRDALASKLASFESSLREQSKPTATEHVLDVIDFASEEGTAAKILDDRSVLVLAEPADKDTYLITAYTTLTGITAIRLDALTDASLPGSGPGVGDAARPNFVLNSFELSATPAMQWPLQGAGSSEPGDAHAGQPIRFSHATADYSQKNYDVAGAIDDDPKTAWAIGGKFHEPHYAIFEAAKPFGFAGGTILRFRLVQHFGGSRMIGRIKLSAITGDVHSTSLPAEVSAALAVPAEQRTPKQRDALVAYAAASDAELTELTRKKRELETGLTTSKPVQTLVMQELPVPRESAIFMRGDYTKSGDRVTPGTPAELNPLPARAPANRLGLAAWLTSRDNPLTARVVVNRWWAEIFGRGIVASVEDFGIKGDAPTHPELLDWLAVEFVQPQQGRPWSMKHMLELMVTSSTYRQSSKLTPELRSVDDANKLLARGPRLRMDAEMIRDNALAISGLLSLKQFGPPIRPPQPAGLWTKVGGEKIDYVVSPGEEKNRRGIYVVFKRASPYPSFVAFDAPGRMACALKRFRSNTPLQALTLLNDPVYVEAAKALALRILQSPPPERFDYAFRLCVARAPKPAEIVALRDLHRAQHDAAEQNMTVTRELCDSLTLPHQTTPADFAAWYAVASAMLNLDETITKQ
jgi:hypothetical protein